MGDVVVLETTQHVGDGIALADIAEELVAQPLALRCAAHEAGDIDELQLRRHDLGRFTNSRDLVEPRIGHGDAAGVRLDRAEGVVGRLSRLSGGQRIEQRRLADVWQADNAAIETHGG